MAKNTTYRQKTAKMTIYTNLIHYILTKNMMMWYNLIWRK